MATIWPGADRPIGLAPEARNQDPAREGYVDALTKEPARPLIVEAAEDPGRQPRTYAPAAAHAPREPIPGDRELIGGRRSGQAGGQQEEPEAASPFASRLALVQGAHYALSGPCL